MGDVPLAITGASDKAQNLIRCCTQCGILTPVWCDGGDRHGACFIRKWCLAHLFLNKKAEYGYDQCTPICKHCDLIFGGCRYCLKIMGCVPPPSMAQHAPSYNFNVDTRAWKRVEKQDVGVPTQHGPDQNGTTAIYCETCNPWCNRSHGPHHSTTRRHRMKDKAGDVSYAKNHGLADRVRAYNEQGAISQYGNTMARTCQMMSANTGTPVMLPNVVKIHSGARLATHTPKQKQHVQVAVVHVLHMLIVLLHGRMSWS